MSRIADNELETARGVRGLARVQGDVPMVRRPTMRTCLALLILSSTDGVPAPAAELDPLPDGADVVEAMASTQLEMTLPPAEPGGMAAPSDHWLDRTQAGLHEAVWRSAMRV